MYHKNWCNNNRSCQCSSNYSETTGLGFYSKDEATNFKVDVAHDNNFKPFKYKAKLLGNTVANGILKNARNAELLKYFE